MPFTVVSRATPSVAMPTNIMIRTVNAIARRAPIFSFFMIPPKFLQLLQRGGFCSYSLADQAWYIQDQCDSAVAKDRGTRYPLHSSKNLSQRLDHRLVQPQNLAHQHRRVAPAMSYQ